MKQHQHLKQFGFKNYRKFHDFPMMDLGGINIFVGKNNSGKSTAIKALIIILQSIANRTFESIGDAPVLLSTLPINLNLLFSSEKSTHLYLGSFATSVNDNAKSQVMCFSFSSNNTSLEIKCIDDVPNISSVTIKNEKALIAYYYKFDKSAKGGTVECRFNITPKEIEKQLEFLSNTNDMKDKIGTIATMLVSPPIWSLANSLAARKSQKSLSIDEIKAMSDEITSKSHKIKMPLKKFDLDHLPKDHSCSWLNDFLFQEILRNKNECICKDLNFCTDFEYIEAHNATHKVLLDSEDKNNFVAQTVHRYYNLFKNSPNPFVNEWMNKLEIGDTFSVEVVDGEAYKVYVHTGGKKTLLGYKGTGSIQALTLLLMLAVIIETNHNCTIFIEEPEQNLHPSLQSFLADLFYDVWKKSEGRIRLIAETHSEYLVRKMQVIAARLVDNGDYSVSEINDDFKVYYFPENDIPYSLGFCGNGHFAKRFGEGFFDEAGKSYNDLTRIERGL